MEKKPLQSRQPRLLKNERWTPYVRYQKETDTWIAKAIREEQTGDEGMGEIMAKINSKIRVLMDRTQLDIISRLVAYLYHDKVDDYKEIASDLRKEHIHTDLRIIDQWLNIQYDRLAKQEEKDEKIYKFDKEILDEQSEQTKREYL